MTTPLNPPDCKVVIMGNDGTGKSTLAADFPKPMVVLLTDERGKAKPYLDRGTIGQVYVGDLNQPITPVYSKKAPDTLLLQIEEFFDLNEAEPDGFNRLTSRLSAIAIEVLAGKWRTIVLDSYTLAQFMAKEMRDRGPLAAPADKRDGSPQTAIWATADIERLVYGRLKAIRCNVLLLAHIDADRDEAGGKQLRHPQAMGRMRAGTTLAFSEVYRTYHVEAGEKRVHQLQTGADDNFACRSPLLDAPNPCHPSYASLTANWRKRAAATDAAPEPTTTAAKGDQ